MEMTTVAVSAGRLEVADHGTGEPVLLVQTALTADELAPVAAEPALGGYRRILTHRRGYGASSPVDGPGSIARDAADCAALLEALEIPRAHVVGLSFSGAIAMQLAADRPDCVRTLTLIEPPPVHIPGVAGFRAANDRLLDIRRREGVREALEAFLTELIGPDWERTTEAHLPGSAAQMRADATTFFDSDVPALWDWSFTAADAARIDHPVLYVGGTDSGTWFAEVRELMLAWFPQAEDVVIDGADHNLALTHPAPLAGAIARLLADHPIPV